MNSRIQCAARSCLQTCLSLRQVTADALAVMTFRSHTVVAPAFVSATWRAAYLLCSVSTGVAASRVDHLQWPLACAAVVVILLIGRAWGRSGETAAQRAYMTFAAGACVQFLVAAAPQLEIVVTTWFVLAFIFLMMHD